MSELTDTKQIAAQDYKSRSVNYSAHWGTIVSIPLRFNILAL